jgi:hypothetical protein
VVSILFLDSPRYLISWVELHFALIRPTSSDVNRVKAETPRQLSQRGMLKIKNIPPNFEIYFELLENYVSPLSMTSLNLS